MNNERFLAINISQGKLFGQLSLPASPRSLIIVPRGGDSHGAQAHLLAALLAEQHAVLSIDLLTHQEIHVSDIARNVHELTPRLTRLLDYLKQDIDAGGLPIGMFAVGHAAAAAVRCAAQRDAEVRALVTYQGLIDHAGLTYLQALNAPLLVVLHEDETALIAATERAFNHIPAEHALHFGDAASVVRQSCDWFNQCFPQTRVAGR
ncbi:MAG TPA: hypothetical protein PLW86_18680 [Rhodocyclaceae bacterium]|nr:hypothetical protein [Rhodocyclaceae bacterium]